MKSRIGLLSAMLVLVATACSMESFPSEFEQKPSGRIDVSQSEYYGAAEPALRQLLIEENKNQGTNQFCVIGYAYPNKIVNVWVHWNNEQRLILWRGNSDQEMREQGLVISQRDLKLGKDTVETQNDIKGSTYLVTRAWWQAVAKDCDSHGRSYKIAPFTDK